MNDAELEKILRAAPRFPVPPDLLRELELAIKLPKGPIRPQPQAPWLKIKRWLPEFALALITLSCLIVGAVQFDILSQLREENEALRSGLTAEDPAQASERQNQSRHRGVSPELERLRKDNEELHRLESEIAQGRAPAAELAALRAEHQKLLAQPIPGGSMGSVTNDFFAEAKERAQSIKCINNLKQIGIAARLWAIDNGDTFPVDFLSMTPHELSTPRILVCPSDTARAEAGALNWDQFNAGQISYVMLSPGILPTFPEAVFVQCPIHEHVTLADGSVQQIKGKRRVVERNGMKVLDR